MNQGTKRLLRFRPEVRLISAEEIDYDDRRFAIIPAWWRNLRLEESIRQIGIANPLHVQNGGGRYRIISGYQRAYAARRLGITELPCLTLRESEPQAMFIRVLWENLGTRQLHDLEKARALHLLRRDFGLPEEKLIESYLSVLGIKGDRYHLNLYLELDKLSDNLKQVFAKHTLALEHALKLADWSTDEQAAVLEILRELQLSRNRQKILFDLLGDLRVLSEGNAAEILKTACEAIETASTPVEQFDQIIESLRRRRYPRLSEHEKKYRQLRGRLSIPPSIQLNPPSFFEGTSLSISFSASSPQELDRITLKLRELTSRQEMNEIFKLL